MFSPYLKGNPTDSAVFSSAGNLDLDPALADSVLFCTPDITEIRLNLNLFCGGANSTFIVGVRTDVGELKHLLLIIYICRYQAQL